jgi:hypothetical protein
MGNVKRENANQREKAKVKARNERTRTDTIAVMSLVNCQLKVEST